MTATSGPERLTRAESFLGIHFDFHAGHDCTEVGRRVTEEMIDDICRKVKPDYIQCDCKGHPGISSYPTEAGNPAPGFVRDQLRIWRDVTARHGIALFMHYSGVIDNEACKQRPEWARIASDGTPDDGEGKRHATSVFGTYVDELLIPQFKELVDVYGVDGVWVDGECWGTELDYCEKAVAEFKARTGTDELPKEQGDAGYFEFSQVCREGFRAYLDHYVRAMHEHAPGFQIASNWAYTHFMPEEVTIPVDFISGDYSLMNSINDARIAARVMARQGKPWDLMAWGFVARWQEAGRSIKTAPQLCQEASVVLAHGGGFQAYYKQKRDGSIYPWHMDVMAEVGEFCRARQELCHKAELVPQVGLVLSTESLYRQSTDLFRPWHGELDVLKGLLRCLVDNQLPTEVVMEHTLRGRFDEYQLLVVPEWTWLPDGLKRDLVEYAERGGSLLCIGPACASMFADELHVAFEGAPEKRARWVDVNGALSGMLAASQDVVLGEGAEQFGALYTDNDYVEPSTPAASVAQLGEGAIGGVYFDVAERYTNAATAGLRTFLGTLVNALVKEPRLNVAGSHSLDVTMTRKGGRLMVNLANTAGPHADDNVYTYDEIPPTGPLTVTLRMPDAPRSVRLEPAGVDLEHEFAAGVLTVTVPNVAIHEVVVVE